MRSSSPIKKTGTNPSSPNSVNPMRLGRIWIIAVPINNKLVKKNINHGRGNQSINQSIFVPIGEQVFV